MSAMTATIMQDRIVVLTDACFYEEDGELSDLARKTLPIPGLEGRAVFSSRGVRFAFQFFEAACSGMDFDNWDGFVRRLDDVFAHFDALMASIHPHSAQILMAGWSESRGVGEVLFRTSHAQYGLQPKVVYVWNAPGHVAFGVDSDDMGNPVNFDPECDGVPAFERARAMLNDLTCGSAANAIYGHSVGGWVDCTSVGPAGVTPTRTIHTWPDVVGQKITVAADTSAARAA